MFGPDLGMPHTRAMGGDLFELRVKAAEGIARIFYCTIVDRRIVMSHHFIKKSQKTPHRELTEEPRCGRREREMVDAGRSSMSGMYSCARPRW